MIKEYFQCRICGSPETTSVNVREMMYGSRHEFKYWDCNSCGCLQIEKYPANIAKYYPYSYYSFEGCDEKIYNALGFINRFKTIVLLYNHLVFKDVLKNIGISTSTPLIDNLNYLNKLNLKPWSKILDIGCGNARFLCELYKKGFHKLTGIDKFIDKDFNSLDNIKVFKKDIKEIISKYDLITMHHVLEHMPSQQEVFNELHKKLNRDGILIVRIPVKNEAWDRYKENWVQIDAPRHYYIHTTNSIKYLAVKSGFHVMDINYDSYSLQFWGSEQYKLNIPLRGDQRSYAENKSELLFSRRQLDAWSLEAEQLNRIGRGDQVVISFKKNA